MPTEFLSHREARALSGGAPEPFTARSLFLGAGPMPLEVAVYTAAGPPTNPDLRKLHEQRLGKRAAPLVVVVLWGDNRASVASAVAGDLNVIPDLPREQAERLCEAALRAPDRHAALRLLEGTLGQMDAPIPGLRNAGLFALHELQAGVPRRGDWAATANHGRRVLGQRGRRLIEQLGFGVEPLPGPASILVARGSKVAVAVFLERPDEIEPATPLFDGVSPISWALARADRENLDYVVVAAGSTVRVYPVRPGVGTGRRGRTETFVELNLDLLRADQAGYLWLLISADALKPSGTFTEILSRSADYAADLGSRLRERVYEEVVPGLARALVKARRLRNPSPETLRDTYEMALLVLFRLLFVAYAEDKELLPLHASPAYQKHSLKSIAKQLADAAARGTEFSDEAFYWTEVGQLWKAVDRGNKSWGVPAYNGGLFAVDANSAPLGATLDALTLPDTAFGPALAALVLDQTSEGGPGPIDFRSLGVREFGTIYEGLLESELSVAESDLAVDPKSKAYLPAKGKAKVVVEEGAVYLHNASGARKSSGAYYTKDFAVEHLLDQALEPALTDHLARLDAMETGPAADRFFDFRVADIAMGSGHFLVAAVDRIERRLSTYLATRALPGVRDELERLRRTAAENLGADWIGDPIEDTQLLRRQIARRCIFGVDLNPMAVDLARLSLWIHTFVPGLPLSFLDANLVVGNSLVGIATLEEASVVLGATYSLFASTAVDRLAKAREPLARLARLAEATAAEIKEARKLHAKAREAIRSEEALLTVLAASRVDDHLRKEIEDGRVSTRLESQGDVFSDALVRRAEKVLAGLEVFHFPVAFPQVFLGDRRGFDVILGNPPWEKARLEEHAFWARHSPGLRSLPQREQEAAKARFRRERPDLVAAYEGELAEAESLRRTLTAGPYPGMGTGDPDLYKAFCWRFWNLACEDGGRIGVVLPRSALAAKGSTEFRREIFSRTEDVDVTMLLNNRQWFFEDVHPQYTIGLVALARREAVAGKTPAPQVALRGPYPSLERYNGGMVREPAMFYGDQIQGWNDTASLPLLPTDESVNVFTQLRKAPRLDLDDATSWRARPHTELHATNDKGLMDLKSKDRPRGFWPVFKGESFDLWTPDTGTYYAWAGPKEVLPHLQEKRLRSGRGKNSPFSEFDPKCLRDSKTFPCLRPRIAFRDVSRATDSRTLRAALVPPEVFITHKGPYLLWPRGYACDEAYLLGVLSSLPLDWYARRFVETNVVFFLFNAFPIPRPPTRHPLRRRAVALAGRLASPDDRFAGWAKEAGVACGPLAPAEKEDMIHELDAVVAHLYGLTERHVVHLFETFHQGWGYQDRLDATLKHFHHLKTLT